MFYLHRNGLLTLWKLQPFGVVLMNQKYRRNLKSHTRILFINLNNAQQVWTRTHTHINSLTRKQLKLNAFELRKSDSWDFILSIMLYFSECFLQTLYLPRDKQYGVNVNKCCLQLFNFHILMSTYHNKTCDAKVCPISYVRI